MHCRYRGDFSISGTVANKDNHLTLVLCHIYVKLIVICYHYQKNNCHLLCLVNHASFNMLRTVELTWAQLN